MFRRSPERPGRITRIIGRLGRPPSRQRPTKKSAPRFGDHVINASLRGRRRHDRRWLQCRCAAHKTTSASVIRTLERSRGRGPSGGGCGQEATDEHTVGSYLGKHRVIDSAMPLKPSKAKPSQRAYGWRQDPCRRWRQDAARSTRPSRCCRDRWKGPTRLSRMLFCLRSSARAPGAGPREDASGRMRHPPYGCCL